MHEKGIVNIHSNLRDQLRADATKNRDYHNSHIIDKELMTTARELKNNPDIIVRRADNNSNIFITLDRTEYKDKLDAILNDISKFKKITKNPILTLKLPSINS